MNPTFGSAVLRQAEETTDTETEVDVVCGNQGAFCEALYEWTDNEMLAEGVSFLLSTPFKIVIIIMTALILNRITRKGIRRLTDRLGKATADHGDSVVTERSVERAEQRANTSGSLLRSLSTAVIYGAALILMFEVFGISMIPIIASAGVLAIAIGFGAQSVVEDLLRGVFMLTEDQFGVGDRISVGAVNGYVERVTLRTTVIRDTQGTLWHVPNSEIDWVANEAQETSRAMSGVQELSDDAVNIRVIVWVDAGERRRFERHLRQQLKEALDAAGIEIPNRQVDVWMRGEAAAA
ncbi:MAG: mechanosensitive ion channel family protein [Actinobacteria bacterium]|nr:mechanosensitive ion channel family protein [Actinomycetota bacterium]